MMEMVKERYRGYLYIEITPEESRNAAFSEKHGFQVMEDGIAMQSTSGRCRERGVCVIPWSRDTVNPRESFRILAPRVYLLIPDQLRKRFRFNSLIMD